MVEMEVAETAEEGAETGIGTETVVHLDAMQEETTTPDNREEIEICSKIAEVEVAEEEVEVVGEETEAIAMGDLVLSKTCLAM